MRKLLTLMLLTAYSCFLGAMNTGEPGEEHVTFLCSDNIEVVAPRELMAKESVTLANMLEDIPTAMTASLPIPLPNISSSIMKTIINCLKYPGNTSDMLAHTTPQTTFALIQALQFLDIPSTTEAVYSQLPCIQWLFDRSTSPLLIGNRCYQIKKNSFTCHISDGFMHINFIYRQKSPSLPNAHDVIDPAIEDTIKCSKDINLIAARGINNTVQVWDTHTPKCIYTLQLTAMAHKIRFSDDGKFLITSDYHNKIYIWDMLTGKCLRALECRCLVHAIKFSSDNTCIIASCSDESLHIWDTATGKLVRKLKNPAAIISFAISKNNTFAASLCYDHTIHIWNIRTGKNIRTIRSRSAINKIKFDSRNECRIKIYGKYKNLIQPVYVWDFFELEQILSLHCNYILLISKIHEHVLHNEKLNLSALTREAKDWLTLFRSLPQNLKALLNPYVKLPLLSRFKNYIDPTY